MQNLNDLYSYYPTNLYQPFGAFDEHNQWGSTDTPTSFPPSGPLQFHPSMYPPSGLDLSRNLFDYPPPPPPHAYPSYHLGYTPPAGDMSWNSHNLSHQQQMPLIGSKKPSAYDEYPSSHSGVSDMLAQRMSGVNLGNNDSNNLPTFASKEQQAYPSNNTSLSSARPSGPKSYASVVSSDTINSASNKNMPGIRSTSHPSADSFTSQSSRHTRYQPQSSPSNGGLLNWTNQTSENAKPSRTNFAPPSDSEHQYNPKDFNFSPKGARFFVIKSVSQIPFEPIPLLPHSHLVLRRRRSPLD